MLNICTGVVRLSVAEAGVVGSVANQLAHGQILQPLRVLQLNTLLGNEA